MNGFTIEGSIDLLERDVKKLKDQGGGGGGGTAASVSYDHTGTSLVATNVQTAITELDLNVSANVEDIEDLQTDVTNLGLDKQDKLTAGSGIDITDNVISTSNIGMDCQSIRTIRSISAAEKGSFIEYTIPETGWYNMVAVNTDSTGSLYCYIYDTTHAYYIGGANINSAGQYTRCVISPMYLKEGAVVSLRASYQGTDSYARLQRIS